MADGLVSVIVPVYNGEKTLARCLESVLAQTYRALEVVVVNDGSADRTAEIIAEFAARDERVRGVDKANGGVSRARNTGIEKATGQYLRFVDADDSIPSTSIQDLVDQQRATRSDIVMAGFEEVYDDTGAGQQFRFTSQSFDRLGFLAAFDDLRTARLTGYCWNNLYLLRMVRDHGLLFPEDMSMGEDEIFNLEYLAHAETMTVASEVVYLRSMNERGTSLSTKFHADLYRIEQRRLEAMLSLFHDGSEHQRQELERGYAERLGTYVVPYLAMRGNRYGAFAAKASEIRRDSVYERRAGQIGARGLQDRLLQFLFRHSMTPVIWALGRLRSAMPRH